MITSFLQELTEARIYKDGTSIRGKSAESIAELVYLITLLLEVLRFEDKGTARNYAEETLKFNNFDSMKTSGTDYHNLIAVLNNQSKYDVYINSNYSIAIPYLQLRRYLKDFSASSSSHSVDRQFLIKLEEFLKVSKYKSIRRVVADWHLASDTEKKDVFIQLRRRFKDMMINIDIWQKAKDII